MDVREVGGAGDWLELAQDRDRWRALVNTVIEPSGSVKWGEFLASCRTSQLLKKGCVPWSK